MFLAACCVVYFIFILVFVIASKHVIFSTLVPHLNWPTVLHTYQSKHWKWKSIEPGLYVWETPPGTRGTLVYVSGLWCDPGALTLVERFHQLGFHVVSLYRIGASMEHDYQGRARDLETIVSLVQPLHVVGFSYGCSTVAHWWYQAPSRLVILTLMNPVESFSCALLRALPFPGLWQMDEDDSLFQYPCDDRWRVIHCPKDRFVEISRLKRWISPSCRSVCLTNRQRRSPMQAHFKCIQDDEVDWVFLF